MIKQGCLSKLSEVLESWNEASSSHVFFPIRFDECLAVHCFTAFLKVNHLDTVHQVAQLPEVTCRFGVSHRIPSLLLTVKMNDLFI